MSLLGSPLEREQLDAIRRRFPGFKGKLPEEAKFWTQADVELFCSSGGQRRPQQSSGPKTAQSCALLSRARVKLAEQRISEATLEYRSFCRQLKETKDPWRLSSVAECVDVPRVPSVPAGLRSPVLVDKQRDWAARLWNMQFFAREFGEDQWLCCTRYPRSQDDVEGIDAFGVETTVEEYVEYVKLIQRADRKCVEENSIAFPRMGLDGWLPFCSKLFPLFAGSWKQLAPPNIKDLTPRWVRLFANAFNMDWQEALARYYEISIRATGTIDRLHTQHNGAHLWMNQIEGRRVFYLFPPQESHNLYAGYDVGESPVDIFFPSAKRHPLFSEARAQAVVLYLGQTLVIPSGWWWYSVAIEPSVTLSHQFWNLDNKVHFAQSLREKFDLGSRGSRAARETAARSLESIHEQVIADEDSDMEE